MKSVRATLLAHWTGKTGERRVEAREEEEEEIDMGKQYMLESIYVYRNSGYCIVLLESSSGFGGVFGWMSRQPGLNMNIEDEELRCCWGEGEGRGQCSIEGYSKQRKGRKPGMQRERGQPQGGIRARGWTTESERQKGRLRRRV